ncbi:MAG: TrmH family RNA methyltransferase [Oligoflexales bacterium]
MVTITSQQNEFFRRLEDLLNGKGIRRWNEALVHGLRFGSEVARDFPDRVKGWIVSEELARTFAPSNDARTTVLAAPLFREIDIFGTNEPLLHVTAPALIKESRLELPPKGKLDLIVPFQNPENVGGVIRTAAALGIRRILLTEEAAHPLHPKSIRAAAGAVFRLPQVRVTALSEVELDWDKCVALSAEGSDLRTFVWPTSGFLIPGIEGPGLPENIKQRCRLAAVPVERGVESLNGMVATAIAIYSWRLAGH